MTQEVATDWASRVRIQHKLFRCVSFEIESMPGWWDLRAEALLPDCRSRSSNPPDALVRFAKRVPFNVVDADRRGFEVFVRVVRSFLLEFFEHEIDGSLLIAPSSAP
jgi:hypothetical protein